jgi:hypothetical protein
MRNNCIELSIDAVQINDCMVIIDYAINIIAGLMFLAVLIGA